MLLLGGLEAKHADIRLTDCLWFTFYFKVTIWACCLSVALCLCILKVRKYQLHQMCDSVSVCKSSIVSAQFVCVSSSRGRSNPPCVCLWISLSCSGEAAVVALCVTGYRWASLIGCVSDYDWVSECVCRLFQGSDWLQPTSLRFKGRLPPAPVSSLHFNMFRTTPL